MRLKTLSYWKGFLIIYLLCFHRNSFVLLRNCFSILRIYFSDIFIYLPLNININVDEYIDILSLKVGYLKIVFW